MKELESAAIKSISSAKLMTMPIDERQVHLQQPILSEMNASAVPQFGARADYSNGLDTVYIFCYAKKMILFTRSKRRTSFPSWDQQGASHVQCLCMSICFESIFLKISYEGK